VSKVFLSAVGCELAMMLFSAAVASNTGRRQQIFFEIGSVGTAVGLGRRTRLATLCVLPCGNTRRVLASVRRPFYQGQEDELSERPEPSTRDAATSANDATRPREVRSRHAVGSGGQHHRRCHRAVRLLHTRGQRRLARI
jgi:hypothetical protein